MILIYQICLEVYLGEKKNFKITFDILKLSCLQHSYAAKLEK